MAKGVQGKCKKAKRNENKCKVYFNSGRRERNKTRLLKDHIVRHPNDLPAQASLKATGKLMHGERAWKKRKG